MERLLHALTKLTFIQQSGLLSAMRQHLSLTTMTITPKPASVKFLEKKVDKDQRPTPPENHVDYSSEGGPTLSLLWSQEPLVGQSLYLGGEVGCDDRIYCIPGHASRVLVIDASSESENDRVYHIGPEFAGKFKWLRGVCCGAIIYGLPCHADSVLRIHVPTGTVTTIPLPYSEFYSGDDVAHQQQMTWKYHGGTISPSDGCVYAIPQSAWHVLRIDPKTETCDFVPSDPLRGRYKWYGGVVGDADGAIYGIPHNSASVIRIDPSDPTNVVTLHGDYGNGGHKWHGAAKSANGTIVSVPANADTVLCITPGNPPSLWEIGGPSVIQTGRHRKDGKYKYLGAMAGTDGRVYCFPCGSERVLRVDTNTREVTNVGPNLYDTGAERLLQNKWQNGLTSAAEQCVYAIPLAAETVLRIDTSSTTLSPRVTTWHLPSPFGGLAKWEGGVMAKNGNMYCVPNNHKAVLRIKPLVNKQAPEPDDDESHLAYTTGIPTLRSSAHRVKYPPKLRKCDPKPRDAAGQETDTTWLPVSVCRELCVPYDQHRYDFCEATIRLLERCDPSIVGTFRQRRLEDLQVPPQSLSRESYGGCCESAQKYLSDQLVANDGFLALFDAFVENHVLPNLKRRLLEAGSIAGMDEPVTFYCQRPPTLRLQPGPAFAHVKAHHDAKYGHQNGELNYWVPLTDPELTRVDLHCESQAMRGDYHPLRSTLGEMAIFHGSSCRHYVNSNKTTFTRVSFDFRVGVQGFFDPHWQMLGTTSDHDRRVVTV